MPPLAGIRDYGTLKELGAIPGEVMPDSYTHRWDKRDDFVPRDLGWIGEDQSGVFLRQHPEVALAQDPDYWPVVTQFQVTSERATTVAAYSQQSNWWTRAWVTMLSASNRKELAEIRAGGNG